jgi:hypothetical protein
MGRLEKKRRVNALKRTFRIISCRNGRIGEEEKSILGPDFEDVMDLRQDQRGTKEKLVIP